MTKRKRTTSEQADLPVGAEPEDEVLVRVEPDDVETQTVTAKITKLTVSVPSLDVGFNSYQTNRVDVQNMSGKQRAVLKCTMLGLQEEDAVLENGKIVSNYSDTVKYILENLR